MQTPLALFDEHEAFIEERRECATPAEWRRFHELIIARSLQEIAELDPDDIRHLPK